MDFESILDIILIILFVGVPFILYLFSSIYTAIQNHINKIKEAEKIIHNKNILDIKKQELLKIQNENIQIQNSTKQLQQDINNIIDNSQNCPYLATRIADFFEILDTKEEEYLKHKKNPAITASQIVSEIKKEKKELLKNNKLLQYQLDYLVSTFPMLEDAMSLETAEIQEAIDSISKNDEEKSDYEILQNYISPEEYEKLSKIDKYQLALNRYLNKKKKSLWEIGISYERYIGYIYETKGYKVIYNGALNGFKDLGRDIIAENLDEILIIQCKYWKKERIIRENVVFQLYGTMILKQLNTNKRVKGILVTTTTLSEEAKKIAKYLNIQIRENERFDKSYPCIKCNINKTSHEKIYHLPFDQQYDCIQIELQKGEKYVSTVKEAETLGYRRAKKHIIKNT